ncbi:MAG: BON domain-containing protein, partial [Acidobacteriota bacterium]|nr:BON domain-containing protein [Acidobacteriota bacterium]
MASETILCKGCGITLVPLIKVCPRCGEVREDSTLPNIQAAETGDVAKPVVTSVVSANTLRQEPFVYDEDEYAPARNVVLLSPEDSKRRFPLLTGAQISMVAVGIGLVVLAIVIAILLWRQQRRDVLQSANAAATQMQTLSSAVAVTPSPNPSPTPGDDSVILESVKSALMAYNPLGFTRYKFELKDGIVTINGEAEHQPEKDGAENVVRLLVGVKSVVNNLQVKPSLANPAGEAVKLNLAEATLLDDALRRQALEKESKPGGTELQMPALTPQRPDPQREAERQRREQLAAKQREEDAAMRKAAEEKIKREAEEYEKRLEESRNVEANRRARAEQARLDTASLRFGTIAWNGVVDGVDEILISGSSASVRHVNGNPPREVRASFSAPVPRSPADVKLVGVNGRGLVDIVQQPAAVNGL